MNCYLPTKYRPLPGIILGILFLIPFYASAQTTSYKNAININSDYVIVEGLENWRMADVSYQRNSSNLTSIVRLEYANRFQQYDYFSEVVLYPVFTESLNGRFDIGTSITQNDLFPQFRTSGTLFYNLTPSLIGGAGIKYQSFEEDDFLLYDLHLHYYLGSYLLISQGSFLYRGGKLLSTALINVRKYFGNRTYIGIKASYGQTPQDLRFQQNTIQTFEGTYLEVGGNLELTDRWLLRSHVHMLKSNFENFDRLQYGLFTGLMYSF